MNHLRSLLSVILSLEKEPSNYFVYVFIYSARWRWHRATPDTFVRTIPTNLRQILNNNWDFLHILLDKSGKIETQILIQIKDAYKTFTA